MKNILVIISVIAGLILIGCVIYYFVDQKITKLENEKKGYVLDIEKLKHKSDSLQPLITESENKIKVLTEERKELRLEVEKWKEKIKEQEVNSQKLKSSVNKFRKDLVENKKKYEELKKARKTPSNEQTIDFFEKY